MGDTLSGVFRNHTENINVEMGVMKKDNNKQEFDEVAGLFGHLEKLDKSDSHRERKRKL